MGVKTDISWTDSSWNPVYGCSMAKGSETGGCLHCYAARLHTRELPGLVALTGTPLARMMDSGPRWTGEVGLNDKALPLPLRWKKPRRIFVNSLSDLFHEKLSDAQIDKVFAVMALCPQHTFQVLTKRPERMKAYLETIPFGGRDGAHDSRFGRIVHCIRDVPDLFKSVSRNNLLLPRWPLPNVWLGVSVENQDTYNVRAPLLLQTPAAKRFVSYEPALGPVDFSWADNPNEPDDDYVPVLGGCQDGALDRSASR